MNKLKYIFLSLIIGFAAQAMEQPNPNEQLISAVERGDVDGVKKALTDGANVNAHCQNGWTPLTCAAYFMNQTIMQLLIESGAKVTLQCAKGYTPLKIALLREIQPCCELIIDQLMKIPSAKQWKKVCMLSRVMLRRNFDRALRSHFVPFLRAIIEQENREFPKYSLVCQAIKKNKIPFSDINKKLLAKYYPNESGSECVIL